MSDKTRELLERALPWISKQDPLSWNISAYLADPRPEFVPLTEEELVACWGMPYSLSTEELRRFARNVEKAALEKNR